jgi:hypothetical protein
MGNRYVARLAAEAWSLFSTSTINRRSPSTKGAAQDSPGPYEGIAAFELKEDG